MIWVHDPDYFLPSINPDIIPQTGIRIEAKPKIIWIYLRPVYYERLSKSGEMKEETNLQSIDTSPEFHFQIPPVTLLLTTASLRVFGTA